MTYLAAVSSGSILPTTGAEEKNRIFDFESDGFKFETGNVGFETSFKFLDPLETGFGSG